MALETSDILRRAIAENAGAIQATMDWVRDRLKQEPNAWRALSILRRRNKPGATRFIYERRSGFVTVEVPEIQGPPANKHSMCTGVRYPGEKRACGNIRVERPTAGLLPERSAHIICDCGNTNIFTFDRPPTDGEIAHAVESMVNYHRERIPAA